MTDYCGCGNMCFYTCREAFSGFDAEAVGKYNEKKITSLSFDYGIELSLVRGAVDNSNRILEVLNLSLLVFLYFSPFSICKSKFLA